VTGFGDFSPKGVIVCFEHYKSIPHSHFVQWSSQCISLDKKLLGLQFFTNSSGHPAPPLKSSFGKIPTFMCPAALILQQKKGPKVSQAVTRI
jgi:hypothetical protein